MQRARLFFAVIAACGLLQAATPSQAQRIPSAADNPPAAAKPPSAPRAPAAPKMPPEKPYKPIAVTVAPAPDDPSFASFRQQIADAAKKRIYAELTRLVVAQGFFWAGDTARAFDPKRTPAENFARAIRLEGESGGWNALATFAALPDAAPMASRPGVICAPARPLFDEVDFDRVNTAAISPAGWIYPRATGAVMRAAPQPEAAVIERLGLHFVRLLGYEGETQPDSERNAWARVAAPSGKTGFVAPGTLFSLRSDRLCYLKDVTGRWRIAGYVTAED
jgi:hypothetical protein